MKQIHEDLCKNYPWYAEYHRIPAITLLHFLVLIAVGSFVAQAVRSQVDIAYGPESRLAVGAASQQDKSKNIAQLTGQVLRAAKQYDAAPEEQKETSKQKLIDLLQERKALMISEAANNPHSFLLNALPSGVTKQLPAFAQEFLEREIDLDGTMAVVHVDAAEGGAGEETRYDLEVSTTAGPKRYHVRFDGEAPSVVTGSKVKVRGVVLEEELVAAGGGSTGGTTVVSQPAGAPTGPQSTVLILVNFVDNATQPWTPTQAASTMFTASNSTNLFYQQNSFGAVSITGDVVGWYTLPISYVGCDSNYYTVATEADKAAVAAGVDLSKYTHKTYLYNSHTGCSWGGMGTIGGNPSQAWIFGYNNPTIFAHEFGHNILAHHAQWLKCGAVSVASGYTGCSLDEYGDPSDVMGYNWSHYNHYVGPRKIGENWLTSSTHMQTVTGSGTYTLTTSGTNDASIKVLKIAKPDTNESYYLDYRQPSGFDGTLPVAFVNGVAIRIWSGNISSQTKLVDTTPGDGSALNAPLSDGRSFVDATNGITITQASHSSSGVTINVQMAEPPCVPASPTFTLSPLSQSGAAGMAKTYSFSLKNNDNSACSNTTFTLSNIVPSGWSATFSAPSITLAPGATGSGSLSVISAASALDGSYTVTALASDSAVSGHNASAQVTYVSFTPDTSPPTTNITLPSSGSTVSGQIAVSATASDNVGVSKVELWRDGVFAAADTLTPYDFLWDTNFSSNGTHTLQTKAYDGSGNVGVSPIVEVTVSNTDNTPPVVSIPSPTNGSKIKGNGSVKINTSATDVGGIARIELAADGTTIATCSNKTSCSTNYGGRGLSAGTHTITATATDKAGNTNNISITINK